MARILIVDDEQSLLEILEIILQRSGHQVETAASAAEALERARASAPDLTLLDLRLGADDGLDVLRRLKALAPQAPVIVMTAYSTWDNAVEAMRLGAFDFLKKPFDDNDQVREVVARALAQRARLDKGERREAASEILGNSPGMREVLDVLELAAPTDATVLVTGESGTGKELLARALHYTSPRAEGPFLSVNCGAFSETLLESELFGHVRGAFSGAYQDKKGLVEVCDKGTFFLDEIGELSPALQVKLLRLLEDRRVLPVGATTPRRIDVRFVCATNKDLEVEAAAGRFRADLYYRINVMTLRIPPLRERRRDIPLLAAHFIAKYTRKQGKSITGISPQARAALEAHTWPGNVRELENTIQRAVTLTTGETIEVPQLGLPGASRAASGPRPALGAVVLPPEGVALEELLADLERRYLVAALEQTGGHLTNAAKLLGISFRAIRYKVKKYELERGTLDDGAP